jgi:uncharacterized membrane protein YhhN
MKIDRILLILFFIVSAAELISEVTSSQLLHTVTKPMIMISLLAYYITASSTRSLVTIAAMLASLAGDVLLINPDYFIGGLIAFLISHVLYIFSYRQHQDAENAQPLSGVHRARLAFPILLAGSGLVVILYPVLGALKIPVIIYATIITGMALTALFRYGRTTSKSFWFVFVGAVLFMISDSILAINKFLTPVENAGFLIMVTYISAQYCIARGLVEHER